MVLQNDAFDVMSPQFPLLHRLCLDTNRMEVKTQVKEATGECRSQVSHLDCERLFGMFVMSHAEAQRVLRTFN